MICDGLIAAPHTDLGLGVASFPLLFSFSAGEGSDSPSWKALARSAVSLPSRVSDASPAYTRTPTKTTARCERCRRPLSDTFQERPSLGILMPRHPARVTFTTKQGWMPAEMIQVRANVARVLSPGKLRNFPRMKLRERGKPGALTYRPWQTTRPQCQSNKTKGSESGEESALRTCRTLVTNRWLDAKE